MLSIPLGLHILIDCLWHVWTVLGDRDIAKNKIGPLGALLLSVKTDNKKFSNAVSNIKMTKQDTVIE